MYQTRETVFHHISKNLKFLQKHSAACRIFNSLLSVWKYDETLSLMFHIITSLPLCILAYCIKCMLNSKKSKQFPTCMPLTLHIAPLVINQHSLLAGNPVEPILLQTFALFCSKVCEMLDNLYD